MQSEMTRFFLISIYEQYQKYAPQETTWVGSLRNYLVKHTCTLHNTYKGLALRLNRASGLIFLFFSHLTYYQIYKEVLVRMVLQPLTI